MGSEPIKASDLGVSIGQVLDTKYRVDKILGHGGMGIVCACTNLQLNKKIAIKMLRPDVLADFDATERFKREAHAASQLSSEYVAKVTDYGVFQTNNVPFMVMEYLDGLDLATHLDQAGTIPVQWACDLMLQAAEALSEAHSIGIIHRDVKPTNLFLTWRLDGSALVKVLYFGISKSRTGVDMQLTQTQSLLGTPAYMSPEQMRSAREVDARTDIWSLGTVLYELVEGHRPFEAESFSEMCVKVAVDPPLPMKNAPPALQHVVLRCLAKSPADRYNDMADLGRELIAFSKDPHQSTILVERMQRMVRRSWDNAVPHAIRDSAPAIPPGAKAVPVPGAPVYTRPASSPVVPPRESTPSLDVSRDDSIRALLPPRPRMWPWIVVGLLGFVGGIAVIVAMAGGDKGPPAIVTSPDVHVMKALPLPPPAQPQPPPVKDQASTDDGSADHVAEATHEPIVPEVDSKKVGVKPHSTQTHVKTPASTKVDDPPTKDVTVEAHPKPPDDKQVIVPCDPLAKAGIRGDNDPCAPKHPNQ
ncbi:MAG TPA: serine/threonine-protein kinase [Kofleriaceae bacterium]|nr:serine/threonine-protein kinase [Kofleriaceae bacterium]